MGYTTTTCITTPVLTGHDILWPTDGPSASGRTPNGSLSVVDTAKSSIDQFCNQCLQLEPSPHYPDGGLLKRADVQNEIFDRICAHRQESLPGNARHQLRILKELVRKIQESITDEEVEEYVCRLFSARSNLLLTNAI